MPSQANRSSLLNAVAKLADAGVDVLIYSGPVSYEGFESVVAKAPTTKRKAVTVLLVTLGGDANAAYRIVRYLRRTYSKVSVYVPSLCKSAGTLICIGAHELVISETGELGPLDVQIREQNELFTFRSGLAIPEALDFLESRMLNALRSVLVDLVGGGGLGTERASQIAVNAAVGIFAPIYAKIDPARLGESARQLAVAQDYAQRLPGNLTHGALERLMSGYSSHSFVIDLDETRELFKTVREPSEHESSIAECFGLRSMRAAASGANLVVDYVKINESEQSICGENTHQQATASTDPARTFGSPEEVGSGEGSQGSNATEE